MIVAFRLARVGLHLGYGLAAAALVYPLIGRPTQLKLKQRWSRQLLGMLGVRLQAEATPLPSPALLVANPISWLDIYVINALAATAWRAIRHSLNRNDGRGTSVEEETPDFSLAAT